MQSRRTLSAVKASLSTYHAFVLLGFRSLRQKRVKRNRAYTCLMCHKGRLKSWFTLDKVGQRLGLGIVCDECVIDYIDRNKPSYE